MSQVISIPVNSETASTFNSLPLAERHKLELFLGLQLQTALKSHQSLLEIMDEISEDAKITGLPKPNLQDRLDYIL